jgi:phage terminase large subunit-like protein
MVSLPSQWVSRAPAVRRARARTCQQQQNNTARCGPGFGAGGLGAARCPSETNDGVWFDEEPPMEIYIEGLTRTNNGQRSQFAIMTFTPLLVVSDVVHMFLDECGFADGV